MDAPHVPVLLGPLLAACAPVRGTWLDGTFGAGGYARGLLDAGAERVIGIDRDPEAHRLAAGLVVFSVALLFFLYRGNRSSNWQVQA